MTSSFSGKGFLSWGPGEWFGSSLGCFCRVLKSVFRGVPFVVLIFKEMFDHFPLVLDPRALGRRTVGVLDLPSVFDFRHLAGLISSGYGECSEVRRCDRLPFKTLTTWCSSKIPPLKAENRRSSSLRFSLNFIFRHMGAGHDVTH